MRENGENMNGWEKLKVVSLFTSSIFIPIAVVLIANWYSAAIKEKEISARYVELAVNILKEKPTEDTIKVREWAAKVLNYYSKVPMDEETLQELRQRQFLKDLEIALKEEKRTDNLTDEEVRKRIIEYLDQIE